MGDTRPTNQLTIARVNYNSRLEARSYSGRQFYGDTFASVTSARNRVTVAER